MPGFSNGKVTSSVIFYNRGVPHSFTPFGRFTTVNYEMLKQIARHNVKNGRTIYSFM